MHEYMHGYCIWLRRSSRFPAAQLSPLQRLAKTGPPLSWESGLAAICLTPPRDSNIDNVVRSLQTLLFTINSL